MSVTPFRSAPGDVRIEVYEASSHDPADPELCRCVGCFLDRERRREAHREADRRAELRPGPDRRTA